LIYRGTHRTETDCSASLSAELPGAATALLPGPHGRYLLSEKDGYSVPNGRRCHKPAPPALHKKCK